MAVIEAARSLAGVEDANSTEFGETGEPVVGLLTEWLKGNELERRAAQGDLGGTMRLGAYKATLGADTKIAEIYGGTEISERHRHRYEVTWPIASGWKPRACGSRVSHRTVCFPRRWNMQATTGSSACSSTRN